VNKENIGSRFDDWLREEAIYEQTTAFAIKRVLVRQIAKFRTSENSPSPAKLPAENDVG